MVYNIEQGGGGGGDEVCSVNVRLTTLNRGGEGMTKFVL